jgi:hypothetical protein
MTVRLKALCAAAFVLGFALPPPLFAEEGITLEACRAYALARAPGLERQRLSYSNRVESVVIAKAKYDPVLTVRRGWEDEDDPGRTTGSVSQTLPADLRADFSARYEERDGEAFTCRSTGRRSRRPSRPTRSARNSGG